MQERNWNELGSPAKVYNVMMEALLAAIFLAGLTLIFVGPCTALVAWRTFFCIVAEYTFFGAVIAVIVDIVITARHSAEHRFRARLIAMARNNIDCQAGQKEAGKRIDEFSKRDNNR